MIKGKIVKAISGFYYVETEDCIYECKARGAFKNKGVTPLVGDDVEMEVTSLEDSEGVINEILPRKNEFIRPPICNLETMVVMFAIANPEPNYMIIDKFLAMAEMAQVEIILCVNKLDLDDGTKKTEINEIYSNIFKTYYISCFKEEGITEIKKALAGKTVALAGPSGVGKSTLLNLLQSKAKAETGEISRKTSRGKHTTKHVEMFDMDLGGKLFDTPGFTSFDIQEWGEERIDWLYPEFREYLGSCRFDNCMHIKEPGCSLLKALEEGKIAKSRYESYKAQTKDRDNKRSY